MIVVHRPVVAVSGLLLALALLLPGWARVASADTLPSDQPGASTGWVAIDEKQVQIEVAGLFAYDNVARLWGIPVLGRVGVIDEELEVRFGITSAFSLVEVNGNTDTSGFNNPYFGAKWNFLNDDDIHLSLLAELIIPTGPSPFRVDSVIFRPVFIFGWGFHDDAELIVNVGLNIGDRVTVFFVVGVGISLSDDIGLAVNFSTDSGDLNNSNFDSSIDVGVNIALSGDLQFDLVFTKDLNDDEAFSIYAGVTIRIR